MAAFKPVEQQKTGQKRVKSQPLLYMCDHAYVVISKLFINARGNNATHATNI